MAADAPHASVGIVHTATELGPDGLPAPGSCVKSGCHSSLDLRRLHAGAGCAVSGCHGADRNHHRA